MPQETGTDCSLPQVQAPVFDEEAALDEEGEVAFANLDLAVRELIDIDPFKLAGGAAQCVLEGGRRRALPLREFRVAAIRPVEAGGPSLFTGAPAFRQTAARAHALQEGQMAFFDNSRAPYADFSPPYTESTKKVPGRPFQGMPQCGSLAGAYSPTVKLHPWTSSAERPVARTTTSAGIPACSRLRAMSRLCSRAPSSLPSSLPKSRA